MLQLKLIFENPFISIIFEINKIFKDYCVFGTYECVDFFNLILPYLSKYIFIHIFTNKIYLLLAANSKNALFYKLHEKID